jgi:FkbM family methyltransferase
MLLDVGASGEPPPIWRDIAPHSTYIGFDPDLREIHEERLGHYRASVIIPAAITEKTGVSAIPFYLTASPFCSTTLGPNPKATSHWLEADKFVVQSETTLRATTLDAVLADRKVQTVDWIKLDTQGTDLRLINSLSADMMSRLMAIDTEPGLIEIYQDEDMFVDVHRDLTGQGFWLSHIHTGGFLRMRRDTLEAVGRGKGAIDEAYIRRNVRKTPAYFEARYLRTTEWLAEHDLSAREYLVLGVFALVDGQFGFALDVHRDIERRFGATDQSRALHGATWDLVERVQAQHFRSRVFNVLSRKLRAALGLP